MTIIKPSSDFYSSPIYYQYNTGSIYNNNIKTELNNANYYINTATITDYRVNSINYGASTCAASGTSISYWDQGIDGLTWQSRVVPPGESMRRMIKARMSPAVHRRRTSLSIAMDIREERARRTLRRVIGEQAFKKFVRDGFITVVPKSGLTYRIYPGRGITVVYDRGIIVDRLCVVLQGDFPPTDSILMRYLLILNDEGEFSKYAIKQMGFGAVDTSLVFPNQEVKPLTEAWAALKLKVA